MRRGVLIGLVLALLVAATVRLPSYSVGPGPAVEVMPLVLVRDRPSYPSSGTLIMTSVEVRQLTPLGVLLVWLDPAREVVSREELFLPGESVVEEEERAGLEMDTSKIDAVYVALSALEIYPADRGPGALVESTVPGCPAEGALHPGDVILAIDGTRVRSRRDAARAIEATPPGEPLQFSVRAGGERQDIVLLREACAGADHPLVGVLLIENFPFRVSIESAEVGGPSAGLMYAVALYDLLTPHDLTDGRTIAGTGVIDLEGRITGIAGIEQKVIAAERAGADVFLLPEANLRAARRAVAGEMRLVPAASFDEAVAALTVEVST